MEPRRRLQTLTLALAVGLSLLAACKRKEQDQSRTPTPSDRAAAKDAAKDSMYFPSGQKEGSSIRVETAAPPEIWVGRPYTETLTVTNVSPKEVHDITLSERLSRNFEPAEKNEAEIREGQASWRIGSLKAGESRSFKLIGTPREAGEFRHCIRVDFEPELCATRTAAVAALGLSIRAPREILMCEGIDAVISVRNTGTAKLDAVKVDGALPQGLTVEQGNRSALSLDAGAIAPGESKDLRVRLKPAQRGTYTLRAAAHAEAISSEATAQTVVREPVLVLGGSATESAYAGSPARAEFTVANQGDGPSPETVVELTIPEGIRVSEMGQGGTSAEKLVSWKVGTLPAGESRKLQLTYTGTQAEVEELTARASGRCAPRVQASARTEFRGVPAVLLEVTDDPDPVTIGNNVAYTISVVNQGNADLTQIQVRCTLEDSMGYSTSEGPTAARARDREVTFEPLARLEPKGKAAWRVMIKATRAADARFKVSITSDQIQRPVEETESTHFVAGTR